MTYIDTTVTGGNSYRYRVAAFNAGGTSAFVTLATAVAIQAIPAAPTSFTVAAVRANGNNDTATLTWTAAADPTNFTIQRANNLELHDGPGDLHASGHRQESDSDRESQHGLLLPDPREQQRRRLVRLDERAAVPDSHAVTV